MILPEVSGGEALAGLLRPGNAGSNTAVDHITVLDQALAALPEHARPKPGDPGSASTVPDPAAGLDRRGPVTQMRRTQEPSVRLVDDQFEFSAVAPADVGHLIARGDESVTLR
jgi:hypothetical protein